MKVCDKFAVLQYCAKTTSSVRHKRDATSTMISRRQDCDRFDWTENPTKICRAVKSRSIITQAKGLLWNQIDLLYEMTPLSTF